MANDIRRYSDLFFNMAIINRHIKKIINTLKRGATMPFNPQNLSKEKMEEIQRRFHQHLQEVVVKGSAGGGDIKIEVDGTHRVRKVVVNPGLLKEGEVEILEDLIAAAMNDANGKLIEALKTKTTDFLQGLEDES